MSAPPSLAHVGLAVWRTPPPPPGVLPRPLAWLVLGWGLFGWCWWGCCLGVVGAGLVVVVLLLGWCCLPPVLAFALGFPLSSPGHAGLDQPARHVMDSKIPPTKAVQLSKK